MKNIIFLLGVLFFAIIFLEGCRSSGLVVRQRPSAPYYARPPQPYASSIWIEGGWIRRGSGYSYRPGYWVAPRKRYRHYVPGHWQQRRQGWVWIRGR